MNNLDLEKHYEELESLVKHMPGMVYRCRNDRDWTMMFVSQGCLELTGYDPRTLTSGEYIFGKDIIHPDDQEPVWADVQEAIQKGQPFTLNYRILTRSGRQKWIWERGQGIFDKAGQLQFLEGFILDVTEQEESKQALRESEERFRQFADSVDAVFWMASSNFNEIIYANSGYEKIWGRPLESLFTNPWDWMESIVPEDREMAKEIFTLENMQKRGFEGEYRIAKPDGSIRWIRDRGFPIYDETGKVFRIAGIAQDITEAKKAGEALAQSQKLFKTLATISPVGIFLTDQDGKCEYVNPQWCHLTGLSLKDALGDGWARALYHKDRESLLTAWNHAVSNKTPFKMECRLSKPDGTISWVLAQAVPKSHLDGSHSGFVGSVTDISDRKVAETDLKNYQEKLRRLYAHVEQVREEERLRVAREVHDELGNAFNQVRLELVNIRDAENPENSHLHKHLNQMVHSIEDAYQNVQRVVRELRPSLLDMFGLAEAFEWYIEKFINKFSIEVNLSISPPEFSTDYGRKINLFRILQESLTNIARHSNARKVEVDLQEIDEFIFLVISDDGKGITPEQIENINSFGIMGMQERILSFGGSFEIEGKPGEGTSISIRLPKTDPPPQKKSAR